MAKQENSAAADVELLRYIVEEVDAARDTLELVQQFAGALPIRSYDEAIRAMGSEGVVRFRGARFDPRAFEHLVPSVVFPIETVQQLVSLAAQMVERIPSTVGNDLSNPETARRLMRRASLQSLAPSGRIGPSLGGAAFQLGQSNRMSAGFASFGGISTDDAQATSEEGQ